MEGKEVDDRKDDRGEPKVEINLLSDIKDYRLPQVNINKSFEEMISDTPKLGKSTLGSFERLEIPQNPSLTVNTENESVIVLHMFELKIF